VSLGADLRRLLDAGANVVQDLGELEVATDAVAAQAGHVVEHLAAPATLERAIASGLAAAVTTLGQEAARAASAPRPTSPRAASPAQTPPPRYATRCDRHGRHAWLGTILCANCRRVYQVVDRDADRYAPDVCLCMSQLLPQPEGQRPEPYSARVCCSPCYAHAVREAGGRMS
jgi:hypothetical protein